MKILPAVSKYELYVNVRFRRSSVFPTSLFWRTVQNGMTGNENTTADKISSTYRNCWKNSHFPKKFFSGRWFCRWRCIKHIYYLQSSCILLNYQHMLHEHQSLKLFFLVTSWSQLWCCAYLLFARVSSKFHLL